MPIKDLKFAEGSFTGKDVASLPDNPSAEGISAAQLKARFDNVGKVMVALGKYNELIDALTAQTGAGEIGTAAIGGVDGANVQETLAGLKALDDANKEELMERIGQRVAKTDVVQTRGRSETQVMSQRAVTDAIDAGGGGGAGGGEFEPVGCMKFFAGETLPDGYLWCDGQSYPANGIYKKLFDVIGTAYNQTDDAEGTFRVPDKNTGEELYIIKYDRSYEEIGVTAPPCVWEIAAEDWQENAGRRVCLKHSRKRTPAGSVLRTDRALRYYGSGEAESRTVRDGKERSGRHPDLFGQRVYGQGIHRQGVHGKRGARSFRKRAGAGYGGGREYRRRYF